MDDFNNSEAVQELVKAVAELLYKKDTADHSFKAKVTEIVNPQKYKVLYSGNTYTVSSSVSCEAGDYVWVCAPCNHWNNLYVVTKS